MGFFSDIIGVAVKTVVIPVAIVKDVVDTAQGKPADNTQQLVKDIEKDVDRAIDKATGG